MKAITIYQPQATLITLGEKLVETKTRPTKYRGPLAIHAGLRKPRPQQIGPYWVEPWYYDVAHVEECDCDGGEIAPSCARTAGRTEIVLTKGGGNPPFLMPLGAVVATCELVDCVRVDNPYRLQWTAEPAGQSLGWWPFGYRGDGAKRTHSGVYVVHGSQRVFGDFSDGRYAWLLDNIVPLDEPVPARGKQGFWEWTP